MGRASKVLVWSLGSSSTVLYLYSSPHQWIKDFYQRLFLLEVETTGKILWAETTTEHSV